MIGSRVARLACTLAVAACGGTEPRERADGTPSPAPLDSSTIADAPPAPALQVEVLDPAHGPFAGGTRVVIRGRGFAEGMTIRFGGRLVEPLDVEVVDARRVVVVTPPGAPGPADVTVEVGGEEATRPDGYRYESIRVDPPNGSVAGGTYVVVSGFGTSFQDGDVVSFGASPMLDVHVLGEQQIAGLTPPGVAGSVDVTISGAGGVVSAEDAYTYVTTADPFGGGMAGGPIAGTLNVTVLDAYTSDGIDGAFVAVGDPLTTSWKGATNPFGEITFAAPGLVGPVSVTAAMDGYETTSMVVFDARDVTIFLVPMPDPVIGDPPPGRRGGTIFGHIQFGNATALGSPNWTFVPEPRTPTERKRAYVFTTQRDPFTGTVDPGSGGTVEYTPGRTAWEFSINSRAAALAVVAVAGLYDPARDPDGSGPLPAGAFEAFAVGAARGILVGPGEVLEDVVVVIDVPLDTALDVELHDPPPLDTPGWAGPTEYLVDAYLDLGGEGVIVLPDASATLPPGETEVVLGRLAPRAGSLADASYLIVAGAYAPSLGTPYSVRVVRGVRDLAVPVVVGEFLGTPRMTDPAPGSTASAPHLVFAPEGGTGQATFNVHRLIAESDGAPLFRAYTRGTVFEVPLWDLETAAALPSLPTDPLLWLVYEVTVPGLTFDQFTYRHLNSNFWSAYAVDLQTIQVPPYP